MIVQEAQDFRIGAGCAVGSGKPVLGEVDLPHFVGIFGESVPRWSAEAAVACLPCASRQSAHIGPPEPSPSTSPPRNAPRSSRSAESSLKQMTVAPTVGASLTAAESPLLHIHLSFLEIGERLHVTRNTVKSKSCPSTANSGRHLQ